MSFHRMQGFDGWKWIFFKHVLFNSFFSLSKDIKELEKVVLEFETCKAREEVVRQEIILAEEEVKTQSLLGNLHLEIFLKLNLMHRLNH